MLSQSNLWLGILMALLAKWGTGLFEAVDLMYTIIASGIVFAGSMLGIAETQHAFKYGDQRYTSNWRGSTSGWNWDPKDAPHFEFDKDLPIKQFYPVGHYVHNPGGVPTAMITAWYIAKSIINNQF